MGFFFYFIQGKIDGKVVRDILFNYKIVYWEMQLKIKKLVNGFM